ncbi:MAG: DUF1214 domain-containing protein, partial [Rhodoferax sp.]
MNTPLHRSRFAHIARNVALYGCALALGVGSALWVLKKAPGLTASVRVGAWQTDLHAGSTHAGLYTRAIIAVHALLALDRNETMYFAANHDDAGKPLRSACRYRVEGVPPSARWWSVTAYTDDMFLFDAVPGGAYSLNSKTARLDHQGRFVLTTGGHPQPGIHWLPTPGDRGLVLT